MGGGLEVVGSGDGTFGCGSIGFNVDTLRRPEVGGGLERAGAAEAVFVN